MYHKKDMHAAASKFKFFKLMSYKLNSYHVLFSINCGGRVGQCAG